MSTAATAATASASWAGLVTPTMGEVTAGLRMTQARATWAGDRPRLPAISWTRPATAWSSSR